MYEDGLVRNQTNTPINASAPIAPPIIKPLEDEFLFLPLWERREEDVCDDLRAIVGLCFYAL